MRTGAAALLAVALTATAGCGGDDRPPAAPELVSNPGLETADAPSSGASAGPGGAAATEPVDVSTRVRVDAILAVPRTAESAAFVSFVRAHAESVNRGYATRELAQVTTPAVLAQQQEVIGRAGEQGYAVPSRPRVAVVALARSDDSTVRLDTCLWLPSTEFVGRGSGLPVQPVPAAWRAARATLTRHNDAWRVAGLVDADEKDPIDCEGLR